MKKILLIFLIVLILIIFSLAILEKVSKSYHCEQLCFSFSCQQLIEEFQPQIPSDVPLFLLSALKNRRESGEKISKEVYRQAADKVIIEFNPRDSLKLLGLNGRACGDMGFVREDLPAQAKKFVKRHELEHLLQTGFEKNREFSANLAAAKEYPLGLFQTILFSIQHRAKCYDSSFCYILTLWRTFKTYFLP